MPGAAPEGVAFVEQADLGAVEVAPVEHLDAVRPPHGQDRPEVLALQGVTIQLQGAVAISLAAQVLEQARQVGQALVADRFRRHFQQVVLLADLQQVAAWLAAKQLPVGLAEQLFDPHGDGGGRLRQKQRTISSGGCGGLPGFSRTASRNSARHSGSAWGPA